MPPRGVIVWSHYGDTAQLVTGTDQGTAEVLGTCLRDRLSPTLWRACVTTNGDVPGEALGREALPLEVAKGLVEADERVRRRLHALDDGRQRWECRPQGAPLP